MTEDTILTVEEAAEKLAIRPEVVAEWLMVGRLKGEKANGAWQVRSEDVDAFLDDQLGSTSEEAT